MKKVENVFFDPQFELFPVSDALLNRFGWEYYLKTVIDKDAIVKLAIGVSLTQYLSIKLEESMGASGQGGFLWRSLRQATIKAGKEYMNAYDGFGQPSTNSQEIIEKANVEIGNLALKHGLEFLEKMDYDKEKVLLALEKTGFNHMALLTDKLVARDREDISEPEIKRKLKDLVPDDDWLKSKIDTLPFSNESLSDGEARMVQYLVLFANATWKIMNVNVAKLKNQPWRLDPNEKLNFRAWFEMVRIYAGNNINLADFEVWKDVVTLKEAMAGLVP